MPDMISQPGAGAPPSMGPPGQPPMGSSPMTMPLQQKGQEAAALAQLGVVIRQLEQLLPMLGMASEAGQAVHAALKNLSRHVPAGTVSPGLQQTVMQRLMEAAKQQGPQISAMRGAGGPPQSPPAPQMPGA